MSVMGTVEGISLAGQDGRRLAAAALGILFGVFLLVGAGFAGPSTLHNTAHDSRHSFTLPCH